MSESRTILLADNDVRVCHSFAQILEAEGYCVFKVYTAEAVQNILKEQRIDLILLDIRLHDDNAPWDNSGIELAQLLDEDLPKIMITAFNKWEYHGELPNNVFHYSKLNKPDELVNLVSTVFRNVVRLNHDLNIVYDDGLSAEELIRSLTGINFSIPAVKRHYAASFEELLRRLFLRESRIRIHRLKPGGSDSGVVLVQPHYSNSSAVHLGAPVVVKYGLRDDILKEVDNYQEYSEPFSLMYTTHLIGSVGRTTKLAGAKFMFVGQDRARPVRHFSDVFLDPLSGDEYLCDTVRQIFQKSCYLWYAGKRIRRPDDPDLYDSYTQQLSLGGSRGRTKLDMILDHLTRLDHNGHTHARRVDPQTLSILCARRDSDLIADPLHFFLHQRHLLPDSRYVAITHGDLNGLNIFVDGSRAWLIDFQRTGWGPAVRDAAELECSIKYDMLPGVPLEERLDFEAQLLQPVTLAVPITLRGRIAQNRLLQRAAAVISMIRQQALLINDHHPSLDEYFAAMYFYGLKAMTRKPENTPGLNRRERKWIIIHALYSAGRIAQIFSEAA